MAYKIFETEEDVLIFNDELHEHYWKNMLAGNIFLNFSRHVENPLVTLHKRVLRGTTGLLPWLVKNYIH